MSETKNKNPDIIDSNPTKELFVFMLVRDLTLKDAIGDLVDNSADGAKRLRPDSNTGQSRNRLEPDSKYDGLSIEIIATSNEFQISDNCGGIPSEIAREYAFRFGRPKDMPDTLGSVGQFGIGMKRALFKLGRHFIIESTATNSKFLIEEDVDKWIEKKEWNFNFKELEEYRLNEKSFDEISQGTTIIVTPLRDDVMSSFSLDKFIDELRREIEREQLYNIYRGLKITINGHELQSQQLLLLESEDFEIAYLAKNFKVKNDLSEGELNVEIFAGISEDNTEHGGWYIFCNDRLILGNDQSNMTGWGDKIPKYHSQYNRFRGYVFFNSDKADLLPWNTVKNNMDVGNPHFKAVKQEMIKIMRPVINFLNWVHDERQKTDNPEERILALAIEKAKPLILSKVKNLAPQFSSPKPTQTNQKNASISYKKSKEKVEEAKNFFDVKSNTDVGISTFNYWYDAEVGEE